MKLKYGVLFCMLFLTFAYANDKNIDCLILKDENSIICKYIQERVPEDKYITMQWIEPDGVITREREILIPAFHSSVYDYRYIEGRSLGEWTFKVIDNEDEYITTFMIE